MSAIKDRVSSRAIRWECEFTTFPDVLRLLLDPEADLENALNVSAVAEWKRQFILQNGLVPKCNTTDPYADKWRDLLDLLAIPHTNLDSNVSSVISAWKQTLTSDNPRTADRVKWFDRE